MCVCVCGVIDGGCKVTHHDSRQQTHSFAAVGVWHHVSITDGQEGDRDQPHCAQEVTCHFLFIVISERENNRDKTTQSLR